jgi:hypothetical protein
MKTILRAVVAAAALALAAPILAATPPDLVVGNPPSSLANAGALAPAAPFTLVDYSRPATATGNLTQVKVGWTTFPCTNNFRVRVFHRSGSTLEPAAQSGLLSLTSMDANGDFTLPLSPALAVDQGDLIGITVVKDCFNPVAFHGFPTIGYRLYAGDVQSPVSVSGFLQSSTDQLALGATGVTTRYTALVVPGVGALPGANGAHFKTSLQVVANPFGGDLSGRLVFHPLGVSGSTTDPSIDLLLGAGRAASYPDVMATMGQTGLGSIDVVLDASSPAPVVYARVFNDAGADGTSGLGEPAVDVSQPGYLPGSLVMNLGCTGILSAPVDPATQRINIGMRSLDTDVTISFTLRGQDGGTRATASQTLSPNEFRQIKAEDLFGGTAPAANDYILVSVSGGSIVYGASTDNTTNDPSVQFVTPIGCVA